MTTSTSHQNELPDLFRRVAPDFEMPNPEEVPQLRWGIMGLGGIARRFATEVPEYSDQIVAAVGSRSKEKALDFAFEFGVDDDRAHGSYEELVADPAVDAIYVSTPHVRHKEDALMALRAGKPVLVEKSFAMTEEEAAEVFAEAEKRGLFAMEAMWSRTLPHYRFLDEVVKTGALGKLTSVESDHGQSLTHVARLMQPELGGGAMLDLGVYPQHLANMLLGDATEVAAVSRMTDTGVDAANVVATKHKDGLASSSSQLDGRTPTEAVLTFERGRVTLGYPFYNPCEVTLEVYEEDPDTGEVEVEEATWDARVAGGFQYEAAEAAHQIIEGNLQSPLVPWKSTLEVQRIMDQVLKQAETDSPA